MVSDSLGFKKGKIVDKYEKVCYNMMFKIEDRILEIGIMPSGDKPLSVCPPYRERLFPRRKIVPNEV
jgi:hypothetical protein